MAFLSLSLFIACFSEELREQQLEIKPPHFTFVRQAL